MRAAPKSLRVSCLYLRLNPQSLGADSAGFPGGCYVPALLFGGEIQVSIASCNSLLLSNSASVLSTPRLAFTASF